ncbi:TadE/TadG family type IV pilus assembly protein [Sphingomonadaceae bacterium jetA1]|jgi:Flp pilus assembly protein TadG|uniref:TadE/TadG family type IV pilus assembly protein n=1 Tax=Facivitalis istanbulensis TaxID=3075838 RepID=UPI00346F2C27
MTRLLQMLGGPVWRDRRAVAAVEFALLALPAITITYGLFDLGYRQYVVTQVQNALDRGARAVTVGTGTTTAQLTAIVETGLASIAPNATVVVLPTSYEKFRQVTRPEPITTDKPPLGTYNKGDCFLDINGNGVWDADAGRSGTGGSDDVVLYTATVSYPELLPMKQLLGWDPVTRLTVTTMLKNQPYASQAEPMTVCA